MKRTLKIRPNASEPIPCPPHLSDEARKLWESLSPSLTESGSLTTATTAAFEVYCTAFSDWRTHTAAVQTQGALIKNAAGFAQQHPSVSIARAAGETVRKFAKQFGFASSKSKPANKPASTLTVSDEIRVTVVRFPDRNALMLRYIDPITGKQRHRTARTVVMREAERAGAKWEAELREGRYCGSRITWAEFRQRYEDEVLASLAVSTDCKVQGVFNAVERYINPQRLANLTADRLSVFQSKLRDAKLAESTIGPMLAHLRAALQWAVRMKMLASLPTMEKPKRAKGGKMMKGRPITGEEFDRMLSKVTNLVGDSRAAAWTHYLRGLWLSGLRLRESLDLWWDRDDRLCVVLGGKYPMLRIPAELEKGNKDRLLPIAPEFAEFLLATPEAKRTGPVFTLTPQRQHAKPMGEWRVGRLVSAIGEAAGVKVSTDAKGKVKFASAHDLRRSFGT